MRHYEELCTNRVFGAIATVCYTISGSLSVNVELCVCVCVGGGGRGGEVKMNSLMMLLLTRCSETNSSYVSFITSKRV